MNKLNDFRGQTQGRMSFCKSKSHVGEEFQNLKAKLCIVHMILSKLCGVPGPNPWYSILESQRFHTEQNNNIKGLKLDGYGPFHDPSIPSLSPPRSILVVLLDATTTITSTTQATHVTRSIQPNLAFSH